MINRLDPHINKQTITDNETIHDQVTQKLT